MTPSLRENRKKTEFFHREGRSPSKARGENEVYLRFFQCKKAGFCTTSGFNEKKLLKTEVLEKNVDFRFFFGVFYSKRKKHRFFHREKHDLGVSFFTGHGP
jgi:hypothetical protein